MATEKRLIDANALSRDAFHIKQWGKGIRCVVDWDDIKAAHTVDAVEVVRCKECEFFKDTWTCDNGIVYGYCLYLAVEHSDNGYCHYGKKI